jgi:hypothetical protein
MTLRVVLKVAALHLIPFSTARKMLLGMVF